MEQITIYEDGCPAGTLTLRREGLYTVLEAALPPAPGLTRLWLCGAGERADLGVMEPRPEGRRFCRRYTRTALAALPAPMEYALVLPAGDTAPVQAEQYAPAADPASYVSGERIATAPAGPRNDREGDFPFSDAAASPRHCEAGAHTGCGNPRPPSPEIVKLKTETYLALPCQLRHPRPGLRLSTLDGRDYLLFRYCAKPPTGV